MYIIVSAVTHRAEYHSESESDDDSNIYATNEDFEDEQHNEQSLRRPSLTMISESHSLVDHDGDEYVGSPHLLNSTTPKDDPMDTEEIRALRMRHSSRMIKLPEKDKLKSPRCPECKHFYHIQSDPISAYNGVGIVCDLCGKNRYDNPELVMDAHFYKCERCESMDICVACYNEEKRKIIKQNAT